MINRGQTNSKHNCYIIFRCRNFVITKSDLDKIDTQKMFKIYDEWPEIAKKEFKKGKEILKNQGIKQIVFVGMGGSGIIGDVISSVLSKQKIHISVIKGYTLPKTINSKSLIICISVSGNTSETLTVLENAKNLNCQLLAFSSGGKMEKFCQNNKIRFNKIQQYHSPRASFIAYLYGILKSLLSVFGIEYEDVKKSIKELEIIRENISSKNITKKNESIKLANWLNESPMIYYTFDFKSVAVRFKNSLQENAKMHVITEDIIEACHNNIVAWENPTNFKPIFLRGQDDFIKIKERWEILKEFFQYKGIEFKEIKYIEGNILSKIVCLVYILDFASIYLAVKNKIDPTPVKPIDFIKHRI